jgi:hypothetical protein
VSDLLRVLAVLLLVAANAFFVIGEYSVVTARRDAVAALDESGIRGARAALRLMDDPVRVISTVQVGITAVGILTGAVGEPVVRDLLGEGIPSWLAFVIAFGTVTYLSVVFGELVPKALTLDRAERLAALAAPPIALIATVLSPLVWVLELSASVLLRPFGVREVRAGEGVRSAPELQALVDEAEVSGVIPRAQEELLHNVFDFAGREALTSSVMPDGEPCALLLGRSGSADANSDPHHRGRGRRARVQRAGIRPAWAWSHELRGVRRQRRIPGDVARPGLRRNRFRRRVQRSAGVPDGRRRPRADSVVRTPFLTANIQRRRRVDTVE